MLAESVAIGPGSSLELQTSQGPMTLTVDSPMNQAGYVHAYGFKNGIEYAGFVKLMSSEPPIPTLNQAYASTQSYNQPYVNPKSLLTLKIDRDGSATLNGEPVMASNARTASVLRLLAKKAIPGIGFTSASKIDNEIAQTKSLLSNLEAAKRARFRPAHNTRPTMLALDGGNSVTGNSYVRKGARTSDSSESRQAMYAAMQSLMRSVAKIQRKEDRMEKVVDKVSPAHYIWPPGQAAANRPQPSLTAGVPHSPPTCRSARPAPRQPKCSRSARPSPHSRQGRIAALLSPPPPTHTKHVMCNCWQRAFAPHRYCPQMKKLEISMSSEGPPRGR